MRAKAGRCLQLSQAPPSPHSAQPTYTFNQFSRLREADTNTLPRICLCAPCNQRLHLCLFLRRQAWTKEGLVHVSEGIKTRFIRRGEHSVGDVDGECPLPCDRRLDTEKLEQGLGADGRIAVHPVFWLDRDSGDVPGNVGEDEDEDGGDDDDDGGGGEGG